MAVDDARVSWRHATIRWDDRGWVIEDHGSTNGTFVPGPARSSRPRSAPGSAVHLGNATDGPRLGFAAARASQRGRPRHGRSPPAPAPGAARARASTAPPAAGPPPRHGAAAGPAAARPGSRSTGRAARAGRTAPRAPRRSTATAARRPSTTCRSAASCASAARWRTNWSSPTSRSPATTRSSTRTPTAAIEIVDLGTHNGTYVNGQPVQRHLIGPNDIVGVGHSTFRLVGDRLEEFVDTGAVSFSARHLTVDGRGRQPRRSSRTSPSASRRSR